MQINSEVIKSIFPSVVMPQNKRGRIYQFCLAFSCGLTIKELSKVTAVQATDEFMATIKFEQSTITRPLLCPSDHVVKCFGFYRSQRLTSSSREVSNSAIARDLFGLSNLTISDVRRLYTSLVWFFKMRYPVAGARNFHQFCENFSIASVPISDIFQIEGINDLKMIFAKYHTHRSQQIESELKTCDAANRLRLKYIFGYFEQNNEEKINIMSIKRALRIGSGDLVERLAQELRRRNGGAFGEEDARLIAMVAMSDTRTASEINRKMDRIP